MTAPLTDFDKEQAARREAHEAREDVARFARNDAARFGGLVHANLRLTAEDALHVEAAVARVALTGDASDLEGFRIAKVTPPSQFQSEYVARPALPSYVLLKPGENEVPSGWHLEAVEELGAVAREFVETEHRRRCVAAARGNAARALYDSSNPTRRGADPDADARTLARLAAEGESILAVEAARRASPAWRAERVSEFLLEFAPSIPSETLAEVSKSIATDGAWGDYFVSLESRRHPDGRLVELATVRKFPDEGPPGARTVGLGRVVEYLQNLDEQFVCEGVPVTDPYAVGWQRKFCPLGENFCSKPDDVEAE